MSCNVFNSSSRLHLINFKVYDDGKRQRFVQSRHGTLIAKENALFTLVMYINDVVTVRNLMAGSIGSLLNLSNISVHCILRYVQRVFYLFGL